MAYLDAPDLRRYLVEVLSITQDRWPDLVTQREVDRMEGSTNVLLVATRIAHSIIKRAGVSDEDAEDIVRRAKWVPDPIDMSVESNEESSVVSGSQSAFDVTWEIDRVLHHPATRAKVPEWFVADYWPHVLKRLASGEPMTHREKEIAMYWTSVARGER